MLKTVQQKKIPRTCWVFITVELHYHAGLGPHCRAARRSGHRGGVEAGRVRVQREDRLGLAELALALDQVQHDDLALREQVLLAVVHVQNVVLTRVCVVADDATQHHELLRDAGGHQRLGPSEVAVATEAR